MGSTDSSINCGVAAAIAGDTVNVEAGTYVENVLIGQSITLISDAGRAVTTIDGISGAGALGTVQLAPGVNNVTIGQTGKGFTIDGIDNGSPGLENAAVYIQGAHSNVTLRDNNIVAAGDLGLLTEFGQAVTNLVVDGNEFSGVTFLGPNPADNGFANQFTTPNVPRQLVVISSGGSNVSFTNNLISGTAGGINASSQEQGNNLATIDANNATITGNSFTGTTTRFAHSLRVRGTGSLVQNNTFGGTAPISLFVGGSGNTIDNNLFQAVNSQSQLDLDTAGHTVTNNTFTAAQATATRRVEFDLGEGYTPDDLYDANTFSTAVSLRTGGTFDSTTGTPSGGTYAPALWANIQGAIDVAAAGQTAHAYKGVYNELVTLNKTMTLEGANNGVDARTRAVGDANESWIKQGVSVTASNAVVDGLLIDNDGASVPILGSAGMALSSAQSGYQILNNIIRDNVFGIFAGSSGANATLIQHNLFDTNTSPGSASGSGIYSDTGAHNLTVNENKFTGHTSASVNFAGTQTNIAITNNEMVNDATIVLFAGSNGATVSGNSLTGTTGSGIFVGGGNSNVSITGNTLTDGKSTGISVGSVSANTNVSITNNIINQNISAQVATSANTTRNMISVSNAAGTTTIDGNTITFSGATYGTNVVAARAINVQTTANAVTVSNNTLNGGSSPATTGIRASNVATLNLIDNTIAGFTSGGSLSTVGTVNYTTTGGSDTFLLTTSTMGHNANQAIGYTAVTTLNVYTLGGDDTIDIVGAGAGLTTWVDGGLGADTLNWEGTAGADDVRFITAPTVGAFAASEAVYYADNSQRMNMAGVETRRIRTLGGDDNIVYERLGGSVATGFIIESGDGNDTVVAGLGNDTILGGDGNDRLDGANGNDSIDGGAGDDIIFGGVGNDILIAGSGENQIFGQNGNDTIYAQNGNLDFIDGGAGLDSAEIDNLDLISSIETIL